MPTFKNEMIFNNNFFFKKDLLANVDSVKAVIYSVWLVGWLDFMAYQTL